METTENWVNVPTNSILTIHNQTVMVHPIVDQYYDRSPHHRRSTAFVRTKGLSANEKATSRVGTPFGLPGSTPSTVSASQFPSPPEPHNKPLRLPTGPSIPTSIFRARTPDYSSTAPASASTSTLPRSRTPLAHAEPAPSTLEPPPCSPTSLQAPPMDVRALTAPPVIRAAAAGAPQPAQGNIKKKRASLSAVEPVQSGGGLGGLLQYVDTSPVALEPVRTEYGNPNKIARMFPELA